MEFTEGVKLTLVKLQMPLAAAACNNKWLPLEWPCSVCGSVPLG